MRLSFSYRSFLPFAAFAAGVGLCSAAGLPRPGPQAILRLEQARSLGGGQLAAFLASPDERIAARAALAIGRTKQVAGVPLLEGHLGDPRDAVRAMSVYALGVIGLGSDAAVVTKLARTDRSGAVRIAALDALGRYEAAGRLGVLQERAAARAIASALLHDRSPLVRGRAAIALFAFARGPSAAAAAAALHSSLVHDRSDVVRERAMWAVYRGYAKRVPRSLIAAGLRDRDETVRIEAVRAVGMLGDPSAIALARPLLNDPSWRVQEQAAESIRVLQGKGLTQHLTATPAFVHLPPRKSDPFAALPALPRQRETGKAAAPSANAAILDPTIDPTTAAGMLSPAHGPHPRLRIVTTKGNIYVVLYPEWAPLTVENFLNLTNRGFFDRNPWFRIVPDFVVQTGEKDAKRAPGPGYTIGAEENPLEQNAYVISMGLDYNDKTNTPIRDSAGSEYYITLSPQYHLDNDFTVFGAVTSGFDVLARLNEKDEVIRVDRIADATL
jgi:peptidyl-prolyl cis-trans isomerase B (cyclophilin B)